MILYHRTTSKAARSILSKGFRDATRHYLTRQLHTGVWLSKIPADVGEGAQGETLIEVDVDIPEEELASYEWANEPGGPGESDAMKFPGLSYFREFLIPAKVINERSKLRIFPIEEEDTWSCIVEVKDGYLCGRLARTFSTALGGMVCDRHAKQHRTE